VVAEDEKREGFERLQQEQQQKLMIQAQLQTQDGTLSTTPSGGPSLTTTKPYFGYSIARIPRD
jgi:hypothetical protein